MYYMLARWHLIGDREASAQRRLMIAFSFLFLTKKTIFVVVALSQNRWEIQFGNFADSA